MPFSLLPRRRFRGPGINFCWREYVIRDSLNQLLSRNTTGIPDGKGKTTTFLHQLQKNKELPTTMSDQQQDTSGGDDFSGLSGFFFYVFIVHPITAWILRPGRFERRKSIMYAIAFLAGLAAIKTGKNYHSRLPIREYEIECFSCPRERRDRSSGARSAMVQPPISPSTCLAFLSVCAHDANPLAS